MSSTFNSMSPFGDLPELADLLGLGKQPQKGLSREEASRAAAKFRASRGLTGNRDFLTASPGLQGSRLPSAIQDSHLQDLLQTQAFMKGGLPGSSGSSGSFAGVPSELLNAFFRDASLFQSEADKQYGRNAQQIDELEKLLSGIPNRISDSANMAAGLLGDQAGMLEGLGQQQSQEFAGAASGVMGNLQDNLAPVRDSIQGTRGTANDIIKELMGVAGDATDLDFSKIEQLVGESADLGRAAIDEFRNAINEFQDTSAADASAVALGLQRRLDSGRRQIAGGVKADGTPMTAAEQNAAFQMLERTTQEDVQAATTQIFSVFNQQKVALEGQMANLKTQVGSLLQSGAGVLQGNEQLKLEGARTAVQALGTATTAVGALMELDRLESNLAFGEAEVGTTLVGQLLQSQQGRRDIAQMTTALRSQQAEIYQAATLNTVNLQLQGRTAVAEFVRQNPRSVVSWFEGLLSLYSVGAANALPSRVPGAGGSGGLGLNPAAGIPRPARKVGGNGQGTGTQGLSQGQDLGNTRIGAPPINVPGPQNAGGYGPENYGYGFGNLITNLVRGTTGGGLGGLAGAIGGAAGTPNFDQLINALITAQDR